ncbi:MAG: 8-amino-7-oxononanoate synthase [Planctomycetaceae bacterium]|nr:8-amino-7-oxononanoate synthase [Planctomycetaceae bacterium]
MHNPLDWITTELSQLQAENLRRVRRTVQPLAGGWCEVDGRRLRNFAGNDYLGLAGDPRLAEAARQALDSAGTGARASALVCGRTEWHERLEARLAAFEGAEAALLFPTGYAANVGAIAALVGDSDLVISDRLNHASLIDGCRLSGARVRVYPHADAAALDRELAKHRDVRRKLIVTDGVFSMDGDLAPLGELEQIAQRHDAMLLVDEAHGTGVFGDHGRGACEVFHVKHSVIRVGTLSKALGSQGGFVVGPQSLIDWLWNKSRPQVFSTALSPASCAAAAAALDVIEAEPQRRAILQQRSDELRVALRSLGIEPLAASRGPIVPVVLGDAGQTMRVAQSLSDQGFLVGAIRPPTVPRNSSRLRISVCSLHSFDDVAALAAAVALALQGTSGVARPDQRDGRGVRE